MARRKRGFSRRGLGGGKLMRGFVSLPSIVTLGLAGYAIADISQKHLPQMLPGQSQVLAGVFTGLPGVAGATAQRMMNGYSLF